MSNEVAGIRRKLPALTKMERLELLIELWNKLAGDGAVELSEREREILQDRLVEHAANPKGTIPAEEVINRLCKRT